MAVVTSVKAARDGKITITDGASASLEVAYEGDGNFSFDAPKADAVVIYDRGAISGVRRGNDPVPTFSFTVNHRAFSDGSENVLLDMIDRRGGMSGTTSTGTSQFSDFALFNVTLTVEGTDHGDSADHTAVFTRCILHWSFAEGSPNQVTINGSCYGGITYTGQS